MTEELGSEEVSLATGNCRGGTFANAAKAWTPDIDGKTWQTPLAPFERVGATSSQPLDDWLAGFEGWCHEGLT